MQITMTLSADSGDDELAPFFQAFAAALQQFNTAVKQLPKLGKPKDDTPVTHRPETGTTASLADELSASGEANIAARQTQTKSRRAAGGKKKAADKAPDAESEDETAAFTEAKEQSKEELLLRLSELAKKIVANTDSGTNFIGKALKHFGIKKFPELNKEQLQQAVGWFDRHLKGELTDGDEIPF